MLYDTSCSPLPNNTAIAGTANSRVTCCTGSDNITAVWIDPFGHNVSSSMSNLVNAHNPVQLDIISSITVEHCSSRCGAYSCRLVINATQEEADRLFLIVKSSSDTIGLPNVTNISFQVLSLHRPLSVSLSFNSTALPPTHVYWSTPSSYFNQSHYSRLLNAAEVIYSNVLLIIDISSPSEAAGLYVANISTNGEEFTSLNISLDITRSITDITFSGFNKTHSLIRWKNGDIDRNNLINYIYNNETGQNVSTPNDFYYYPISDNSSYNLLLYSTEDHLLPSEMQLVNFVTQGAPSSVVIDTISSTNSTCLLINWSLHQPVPTLINHALIHHYYNNCSATEQQEYIKIHQNSSSLLHYSNEVCSLQAGLEYCFKISLYSPWDDVTNSSYYCVNISVIPSETRAPSRAPLSLNATNVHCNLTILSWLPLHCSEWISPFSHYSVQLAESEDCSKGSYDQEITSLEPVLNISFPRPFTDYCVRVSQVNIGNNTGPYSQGVHVKSPQCPPGRVLNLTASVGLITAQLSWNEPNSTNGIINNYIILISTSSSSSSSVRNLSTGNKIIDIKELLPNMGYTFSVAAVNEGGIGQRSTITMRTRSIESIRTMNISWTLNEVTVTWYRPVSTIITNIIINYAINKESGNVILINNNTTRRWSHSVTIGDKYNYSISIAAGIYTNNTLINGNFTNLNGCHGNCDTSISLYLWIGGGGGVGLAIIIIILIIITIVWRK
uniref:Fibronectin type-III domain-containing protein n=1 Tax=Amphimedon queenslandica TaxID=400682 RepID=A0A1X7TVR2_AMPQE